MSRKSFFCAFLVTIFLCQPADGSNDFTRKKLAALEAEGNTIFQNLASHPGGAERLKKLIHDVYSLDPSNENATNWARRLKGLPSLPQEQKPNFKKYETILAEKPNDKGLIREAAEYSFSLKDFGQASLLYHKLLVLDPKAQGANAKLAIIAANSGDYSRAEELIGNEKKLHGKNEDTKKAKTLIQEQRLASPKYIPDPSHIKFERMLKEKKDKFYTTYLISISKRTDYLMWRHKQMKAGTFQDCPNVPSLSDCYLKVIKTDAPRSATDLTMLSSQGMALALLDRDTKRISREASLLKIADVLLTSVELTDQKKLEIESIEATTNVDKEYQKRLRSDELSKLAEAKRRLIASAEKSLIDFSEKFKGTAPDSDKINYESLMRRLGLLKKS